MLLLPFVCQLWPNQLKITHTHSKYLDGSAAYLRVYTIFNISPVSSHEQPVNGSGSAQVDINNEQNDTEKKYMH